MEKEKQKGEIGLSKSFVANLNVLFMFSAVFTGIALITSNFEKSTIKTTTTIIIGDKFWVNMKM